MNRRVFCLLLLSLLLPATAWSHATGEDYIIVNFREDVIEGIFEIHFDDLRDKLGLDLAEDEATGLEQLRSQAAEVQDYIRNGFQLAPSGGAAYTIGFEEVGVISLPQGLFGQFQFAVPVDELPERFDLRHGMFYENDRLHRGLLLIEYDAVTDTTYPSEYTALVFSGFNQEQELDLRNVGSLLTPWDMIPQGVLHIWIGIDHILFLLALMLPTVLRRENGEWKPVESFGAALVNLVKIVTVFTIAHSITLLLAALDFVRLPSSLVESVIALSIVLVALSNIFGRARHSSLWVILGLGLFHGLGFASVMGVLPFRMVDLLKSVVGFNIGVELGQVAIVAVMFPILYALRNSRIYVPIVLRGGSVVLALIAAWWFVQRAFGIG